MSLKNYLENFIKEVYPALVNEYVKKKLSLDALKGLFIETISDDDVWNKANFLHLKAAIIEQFGKIKPAERPFVQEEEEINEDGGFVLTALFRSRPSFEEGDLIVNAEIGSRPLKSMIADLKQIASQLEESVEEAKNGVLIIDVTPNPLMEAFSQDLAGMMEEKSLKKR